MWLARSLSEKPLTMTLGLASSAYTGFWRSSLFGLSPSLDLEGGGRNLNFPHSLSSSLSIPKSSQGFLPCGKFKFLPPSLQVQEGEYPNRLDPKNPVYAEETSPSVIVNGFSERLRASHIQRIWPHSENLVRSRARSVPVQLALVNSH